MALSLLIKPCGALCNLACDYCFYNQLNENKHIMSQSEAELLINSIFDYEKEFVSILFQGGEPTLANLSYYQHFVEQCDKKRGACTVSFSFQTNGYLIDENWAKFFKTHNFLVGISLDGDKDITDAHRYTVARKSIFTKVLNNIKILEKFNVDFNILCVISKDVVRSPQKIYNFFKNNNYRYLQFTMPVAYSEHNNYMPSNRQMTDFLKTLFDLWYFDLTNNNYHSIRYFDNLVNLYHNRAEQCGMHGRCGKQLVVDSNLDLYPCDFYVNENYILGNLKQIDLQNVFKSGKYVEFQNTPQDVSDECKNCRVYYLCRCGCKRYRQIELNNNFGKNYFCDAYKEFLNYAKDRILNIAQNIK